MILGKGRDRGKVVLKNGRQRKKEGSRVCVTASTRGDIGEEAAMGEKN